MGVIYMGVEVGHTFPKKTFTVEPHRVEEFVIALGVEPHPGWKPTKGNAVPLGFLMYVTTYGADEVHGMLDFDLLRTVYGGTDSEYFAPVYVGDVLSVTPVISSLVVKETKNGKLTFAELTCEYINADGIIAVREKSTTVERGN